MNSFPALLLFALLISASGAEDEFPSLTEEPRDWAVDVAFAKTNYTTGVPQTDALFSCRAGGSPPPAIAWFVLTKGAKEFSGPVTGESESLRLLGNGSRLHVADAKALEPVVYCEAWNRLGRVRSRYAVYQRHGRLSRNAQTYVSPRWVTQSHALVVCPDRRDLVTERATAGGAVHALRDWGDVYDYEAYYDDHSRRPSNSSIFQLRLRPDIYWNGPFVVVSTRTEALDNLYYCQQVWRPHFVTGTEQLPQNFLHEFRFPQQNGTFMRFPYLSKTIYLGGAPDTTGKPALSVRIFDVNPRGAVVGEPLALDCLSFSGADVALTWRADGRPVNASGRVRTEPIPGFGLRLVFLALEAGDAANYSCEAAGGGAWLALRPRSPLRFLDVPAAPPTLVLRDGAEVAADCRFLAQAWEARRASWLLNGRPVAATRSLASSGRGRASLLLRDLDSDSDAGPLQCALADGGWPSAVLTVARLAFRAPRGLAAPRLAPLGGPPGLRALPNGSLAPALLLVADGDAGAAGRVRGCRAECEGGSGAACPRLARDGASGRGDLLLLRVDGAVAPGTRQLAVRCSDGARPAREVVVVLPVAPCAPPCPPAAPSGVSAGLLQLLRTRLTAANAAWWTASLARLSRSVRHDGATPDDLRLFLAVLDSGLRSPEAPRHLRAFAAALGRGLAAPRRPGEAATRVEAARAALRLPEQLAALLRPPSGDAAVVRAPRVAVAAVRLPARRLPGAVAQFSTAGGVWLGPPALNATGIAVRQDALAGDRVEFSVAAGDLFATLGGVVSPVVGASARLLPGAAAPPVFVTFRRDDLAADPAGARCAFWDFPARRWSTAGCATEAGAAGIVLCRCSHLTNFALLLAVDHATPVPPGHATALSLLSYMLLTLSAACLLLTLAVYAAFLRREMRRGGQAGAGSSRESRVTASKVLISLCVALLLATLVFLAGGHQRAGGPACAVVGVLLHYLYLAVFCWAVVEATHIFVTVIYISLKSNQISIHISHFFLKASLCAWGVPLLVVAITLGVDTRNYGAEPGADRLCFLAPTPFFAAFLAPMLLCLAANIVILVLLAVVLHRFSYASTARGPSDRRSYWRQHVVGFVGICFILNVTWLLGIVQVKGGKLLFQYLHVLVNGLQGFFIFLFYCLFRNDLRKFMRKRVRRILSIEEKSSSSGKTVTSSEMASYSASTGGARPRAFLGDSGNTKTELLSNSTGALHDEPAAGRRVAFKVEAQDGDGKVEKGVLLQDGGETAFAAASGGQREEGKERLLGDSRDEVA